MLISFTVSTVSGSPTVTVSSATGLLAGQPILAAGIPAGAVIAPGGISGTSITLTLNATATATGVAGYAVPEGLTLLTGSKIQSPSGIPLASGRITAMPVSSPSGGPVSATAFGGGPVTQSLCTFLVVNGAITTDVNGLPAVLQDTTLTTPRNIAYDLNILDASGNPVEGPGYGLVQPSGLTWSLDTYDPVQPLQVTVQAGPQGPPVNFRGAYASGTTYAVGDVVSSLGWAWISMVAGNVGNAPAPGSSQWGVLVPGVGGLTAPADTSGFAQVNPNGLASETALNPGITLFDAVGASFGADLAYVGSAVSPGGYATRLFTSNNQAFVRMMYPDGSRPTGQASFTLMLEALNAYGWSLFVNPSTGVGKVTIDAATGSLILAGSVNAAGGKLVCDLNGNLTLAGAIAAGAGSQALASEAIEAHALPTLAQVQQWMVSQTLVPSSVAVSRSGQVYQAWGDSITAGAGASVPGNAWVPLLSSALGTTLTNNGVGGDEACDCSLHTFAYNPSSVGNLLHSVAIGTNDVLFGSGTLTGPNSHETIFTTVHQAILTWLATRASDRVLGGARTTWSGFSDDYSVVIDAASSTTNGSTAQYSITTHGKPLYVWSRIGDGNGGAFTITVDGGTPVAVSCTPPTPIATQNGASTGIQLTRIPVAAGTHTVVITVTSATSASNKVTIMGLGTPSAHSYYTSPTVLVGCVLPFANDASQELTAYYSRIIQNNCLLLQSDGLDIRLVDNRPAMQDGLASLYYVGTPFVHPNDTGYASIWPAYFAAATRAPGPWVSKDVPLTGLKIGTPGDTWAGSDGNIYAAQPSGALVKVAASAA